MAGKLNQAETKSLADCVRVLDALIKRAENGEEISAARLGWIRDKVNTVVTMKGNYPD